MAFLDFPVKERWNRIVNGKGSRSWRHFQPVGRQAAVHKYYTMRIKEKTQRRVRNVIISLSIICLTPLCEKGRMLSGAHSVNAYTGREVICALDLGNDMYGAHGLETGFNYDLLQRVAQDNHCNVLYAEQRGQGNSGGEYMGFGLMERHDCLDWVNWVQEHNPQKLPIYLCGISMGASTVLMAGGLELPADVKGIICFNMGLTLREGNREYFYGQLDRYFPGMKQRYIRSFGNAYELNSHRNEDLMRLFHRTCEKAGILHDIREIFAYLHKFEEKEVCPQTSFFD